MDLVILDMQEREVMRKFEDWVFNVNFGDADLYLKHKGYMKIAYDVAIMEAQKEIDKLKAENEKLLKCVKIFGKMGNSDSVANKLLKELEVKELEN